MKIHRGDTVKILIGKDSGKSGKIIKVDARVGKVLIDGLNLYKKHAKPKKQGEKGEMVSVPRAINASNVALVCSSCKKPTRIGYRLDANKKLRVCKKCGVSV